MKINITEQFSALKIADHEMGEDFRFEHIWTWTEPNLASTIDVPLLFSISIFFVMAIKNIWYPTQHKNEEKEWALVYSAQLLSIH